MNKPTHKYKLKLINKNPDQNPNKTIMTPTSNTKLITIQKIKYDQAL